MRVFVAKISLISTFLIIPQMKNLNDLWQIFLNILFPPICLSCKRCLGKNDEVLCDSCRQSIPIATSFLCGSCGRRIPTIRDRLPSCACKESCILGSVSTYGNGPINELITALKYRGVKNAAKPLGNLMARFIKDSKFDPSTFIVIPVPLSYPRLRRRGYNQAELIAGEFLRALPEMPQEARTDIIARVINSKPQTSMSSRELRRKNIRGAFSVINPTAIKGRCVLLIDDVFTSGATAKEAVKILKNAGARRVIILTAARA